MEYIKHFNGLYVILINGNKVALVTQSIEMILMPVAHSLNQERYFQYPCFPYQPTEKITQGNLPP